MWLAAGLIATAAEVTRRSPRQLRSVGDPPARPARRWRRGRPAHRDRDRSHREGHPDSPRDALISLSPARDWASHSAARGLDIARGAGRAAGRASPPHISCPGASMPSWSSASEGPRAGGRLNRRWPLSTSRPLALAQRPVPGSLLLFVMYHTCTDGVVSALASGLLLAETHSARLALLGTGVALSRCTRAPLPAGVLADRRPPDLSRSEPGRAAASASTIASRWGAASSR